MSQTVRLVIQPTMSCPPAADWALNCPVHSGPQPVGHTLDCFTHGLTGRFDPHDLAVHVDGGMGRRRESNCWIGRHREGDPRRQNRFGNVPER